MVIDVMAGLKEVCKHLEKCVLYLAMTLDNDCVDCADCSAFDKS